MSFLRCFFAIAVVGFVPYGVASDLVVCLGFEEVLPLTMAEPLEDFLEPYSSQCRYFYSGEGMSSPEAGMPDLRDLLKESRRVTLQNLWQAFQPCDMRDPIGLNPIKEREFKERMGKEFSDIAPKVLDAVTLLVGAAHSLKDIALSGRGIGALTDQSIPADIKGSIQRKFEGLSQAYYCLRNEIWLLKKKGFLTERFFCTLNEELFSICNDFVQLPFNIGLH